MRSDWVRVTYSSSGPGQSADETIFEEIRRWEGKDNSDQLMYSTSASGTMKVLTTIAT